MQVVRDLQAFLQPGVAHGQRVLALQGGGQFRARLCDAVGQLVVDAFNAAHVARMAWARDRSVSSAAADRG
ncbi:hypothetical protein G6F31_021450 [Rhizopus arrhizus]|nr:hypothetical protein G6F31_021450 [Rhizopus arrhizus]